MISKFKEIRLSIMITMSSDITDRELEPHYQAPNQVVS